ncbi:hypothetical protein HK096_006942 [Nowakowskiella sp. JEL0078]|nr:hypothetical protein HK096_006942 [Nowakowskiella sp. JEL0078]
MRISWKETGQNVSTGTGSFVPANSIASTTNLVCKSLEPPTPLQGKWFPLPVSLYFPTDMTIWVDPYCVSYRLGNESAPVVAIWENFSKPENIEIPIFSRAGVRTSPSPDSQNTTHPQLHYGNAPITTVSSPSYTPRVTSAYQPLRQNALSSAPIVTTTTGYSRYIPTSQNRSQYSYSQTGYMTSNMATSMTQPYSIQHKIVLAN